MKQTNINSTLFPDAATSPEDTHVESSPDGVAKPNGKRNASQAAFPDAHADEQTVEDQQKEGKIILVDWENDQDAGNPMNWSRGKKWAQTVLLCAMTLFIVHIPHLSLSWERCWGGLSRKGRDWRSFLGQLPADRLSLHRFASSGSRHLGILRRHHPHVPRVRRGS
jgi:hypothetical protein